MTLLRPSSTAFLSRHREVLSKSHWAVNTTTRCQQRCCYCFEGDRAGFRDLSREEVREIIRRAAAAVPKIVFMGAEPTLNPHLQDHIAYARSLGLEVELSTNGLRFYKPGFLEGCVDAGLCGCEISFSYPDAEKYAEITRMPPEGFPRLLEALARVDEVFSRQRSSNVTSPRLGVNVNVVVSRFNVDRLSDVLATLDSIFRRVEIFVTLKWVSDSGVPRSFYLDRCHVPLLELRQRFKTLLDGWSYGFHVIGRGYPFCVFEGYEHLAPNLYYLLDGHAVHCNFDTQMHFRTMQSALPPQHPHRTLCEGCGLDLLCLDRGILTVGDLGPTNRPVPCEMTSEALLRAMDFAEDDARGLLGRLKALRANAAQPVAESSSTERALCREIVARCVRDEPECAKRLRLDAPSGARILVALGDDSEWLPCEIAGITPGLEPAFLCDRVAIRPDSRLLESDAGLVALERIAQATIAICKEPMAQSLLPAGGGEAMVGLWALLGGWLLPRAGRLGRVVHGRLGADEVDLVFRTAEGRRLLLRFKAARGSTEGARSALAFSLDVQSESPGGLLRGHEALLVNAYRARLRGTAGAGPPVHALSMASGE